MKHTISYKKDYRKESYKIYVEKFEEVSLTVYLADYIFYSTLKNEYALKNFYAHNGRLTDYEKEKLKQIKLIKIVREVSEKVEIFKEVEVN